MNEPRHGAVTLSIAERAVLLYATSTYLPQFILHIFAEDAMRERFWFETGTQIYAAFIPCFLVLVYCLQRLLPQLSFRMTRPARALGRLFESRMNMPLALALVTLAVNFALTAGLSFRQSGDILSQAGVLVQLMMFSKPYVYSWLLYHFLRVIRGDPLPERRTRIQSGLFMIALTLSITGSLDALPILWMGAFTMRKSQALRDIFLVAKRGRSFLLRAALLVIGAPVAAALIAVIIALGWINKQGLEGSEALLERIGIGQIVAATMVRASSSYAAVIAFVDHNLTNFGLYEQVLKLPIENVPYRLSLLLSDPLPRPEITQLARLNYLNYESDTSLERAGASPGLIASAFYAAPFPLGFLLIGLYTVVIIRIANLPFAGQALKPRIALAVLVASFIYPLFETPIDYLIFIDPAFAQILLVFGAFGAASVAGRRVGLPITLSTQRGPQSGAGSI
jgi:hypothetical protein